MKEGIPDAPQLQEALAKRWSDMLDFSEFDRPDEPGSWNLCLLAARNSEGMQGIA